ncbi:hypothetical protein Tco_1081998 [Tanacetum coccineum]|uniref:Uncharacterized protein n=1 Tax=Tanacetum coccineum TaxID=301880 RepID=A0ABQ5HZ81_9ASTR
METKVESMVTILIHQASSSVPPLSTLVIDLSPLKLVSPTIQTPIFTATTSTTTTSLPLPQQRSSSDPDLASRVSALEQVCANFEKRHKLQEKLELPEADIKEILHQRKFENGTYKSLPKLVALYEAFKASMESANRDEFLAKKYKYQKRGHDDQDPPPPPPDSDISKKKRHDFDASSSKQPLAPQSSA